LLRDQERFLSQWSRVFVCTRGGRTIGFSLFYEFEHVLYARLVGFDYTRIGSCEYFNVLFYAPLAYALEHGVERIHLGIESYEAKLGRGAQPRPLWCLVRHHETDLRPLEERVRHWSSERLAEFETRYGSFFNTDARRSWSEARRLLPMAKWS
jgi:predicted N-acyltransferase